MSRTLREFKKNRQRLVRREGEVREFDKDSLMFSLRDVKDAETEGFQCSADRDLYDDIMEAFTEGYRVEVIGVQVGQKIEVAAMSPLVGGEERADAALGVTGPGSPDLQEGSEREDLD